MQWECALTAPLPWIGARQQIQPDSSGAIGSTYVRESAVLFMNTRIIRMLP